MYFRRGLSARGLGLGAGAIGVEVKEVEVLRGCCF